MANARCSFACEQSKEGASFVHVSKGGLGPLISNHENEYGTLMRMCVMVALSYRDPQHVAEPGGVSARSSVTDR